MDTEINNPQAAKTATVTGSRLDTFGSFGSHKVRAFLTTSHRVLKEKLFTSGQGAVCDSVSTNGAPDIRIQDLARNSFLVTEVSAFPGIFKEKINKCLFIPGADEL